MSNNRPSRFPIRRRWRVALIAGTWLVYVLAFAPLYTIAGTPTGALVTVPLIATAWFFGMRAGLLAGALAYPLNILLILLAGGPGWTSARQGLPGSIVVTLCAAVIGRLYDLGEQLERELAERQRAEETLATTQALLMAAIEQTPAGVIVADAPDVKIRLANAAALGIRGETPEPLTDIPVSLHPSRWQTFYPDGRPYAAEDLPLSRAILAGETSQDVEVIIRRESGEDRWVWTNAAPVRNAGGEIVAGVVVFLDITERKRVEDEVRRLKDFNESIVQNIAEGIAVKDAQGHFTFVNPAAASMLGYTLEAMLDRHWTSIVPSDQQPIVRAADERRGRGEADRYELELLRQDGTRFSVLVSGSPLPGTRTGCFAGSLAVFTDINERVRAKEELQKAKEQLEKQNSRLRTLYRVGQTVNSTLETDAILDQLTDEAMRVTRASHGQVLVVREESGYFERRSQRGFSAAEIERAKSDLLPLGQGVNSRAYLTQQIVRVDDVQDESDYFPLIPATRTELAVPIIRGGEVLGNLDLQSPKPGAFCDVDLDYLNALTDQVAIAIHNARLYEQARQEIKERRRIEKALERQAQNLAHSNTQLEQFAYVASHDLQEPLRKVIAFGDRLQTHYAGALDERGLDYLSRMQNAAERMQNLITALLTYSRVTTQARPFAPVDLAQVVGEVVSDLEIRIDQVEGQVQVSDLPTIDADPTQMRQLLQNLIGNALKFHRPGEAPVVKVGAQLLDDRGQHSAKRCKITIQDNGIGFDEKYLDHIFQLFHRLHGRSEYEGTGIGLAICRKIVERHGGEITAQSTSGQGATFIITLPVTQFEGETQ